LGNAPFHPYRYGGTLGGCFAWVAQHHSCDQEAFMKAALHDNGWTPNSNLRVLADGADGLTNFVKTAANKTTCETVLDWFHISMRLRPIEVMAPGMGKLGANESLIEKLPHVRYQMWHGLWHGALDRLGEIYRDTKRLLPSLPAAGGEVVRRFRQHMVNLRDYLCSNWSGLRNYAADRGQGLRISSAPAESLMSHLVNQRMGKQQPMRWSCEGAHLLLQVRCAVLDGRLETLFRERYPNFRRLVSLIPSVV
jgi:hypothetical protein